jgi:hypothetical protein
MSIAGITLMNGGNVCTKRPYSIIMPETDWTPKPNATNLPGMRILYLGYPGFRENRFVIDYCEYEDYDYVFTRLA